MTRTLPSPSLGPVRRYVDLNADLGEEVTDDAALLAIVTSANVACGYHAGSAGWSGAVSSAGFGGVQSSGSRTGTRQLAPYSLPSKERP